jgi:hypothetical protein
MDMEAEHGFLVDLAALTRAVRMQTAGKSGYCNPNQPRTTVTAMTSKTMLVTTTNL